MGQTSPLLLLSIGCITFANVATANAGTTLNKIKTDNALTCGIDAEQPEYSTQDAHGNHGAFDLDICKAAAVATLGPNAKVILKTFRDEQDALKALKSGKVDLLATGSSNYINTTNAGLGSSRPIFYDYQAFLVNKTMGVQSPKDLAGKKVCFLGGTEIEIQLQGYMKREKIDWLPFSFQEEGEMEAAFITGNCAAISADASQLGYEQIAFRTMAKNFAILPDVIAKDPESATYRLDDPEWAAIVNWTMDALIEAEESGVTQANLADMKKSDDPIVKRLLGTWHGYGQYLGLRDGWVADVIDAVGNYGEIFQRDLGPNSNMKLDRGPNNLWTNGGLMYALPIR